MLMTKNKKPILCLVGDKPLQSAQRERPSAFDAVSAAVPELEARARAYKLNARAPATKSAYESDFRHFSNWCESRDLPLLPTTTAVVDLYLTAHAQTLRPSTLGRRLVSISRVHQAAGLPSPTSGVDVRETLRGIRNEQGTATKQAAPLLTNDVSRMVAAISTDTLIGLRDRALLLVGFAGAFRASELGTLHVSDMGTTTGAGVIFTLRKSKTDQAGAGHQIAIPYGADEDLCPIRAVRAWLKAAHIIRGAIFRGVDRYNNVQDASISRHGVVYVIRRSAKRAGLDAESFSGHSLRAGLATSAALGGASVWSIKKTTRHKSDKMVGEYVRTAELFRDNAATRAGL